MSEPLYINQWPEARVLMITLCYLFRQNNEPKTQSNDHTLYG